MSGIPLIATKIATLNLLDLEGRAFSSAPGRSNVHLLRNGNGIIHLDAEVSHGALDLGVAEKQLDGPQIARASVDQCCLGSAQRMGPVLQREIEAIAVRSTGALSPCA